MEIEAYIKIGNMDCEAYSTGRDEDGIFGGISVRRIGLNNPHWFSDLVIDAHYHELQAVFTLAESQQLESVAQHVDEMRHAQ